AAAVTVGVPLGDAQPSAGPRGDAGAQQIARSLPTGDGEVDVEWRISAGYSFGRGRRYPLAHYAVAELGYWLRTRNIADSLVYHLERGTQLPYRVVDRFLLILRLNGVESFATVGSASVDQTGLGNGVTYTSPGVEVYGRIWRGLGAAVAWEGA